MKSPLGIDAQLPVGDLLNEAFGMIYQNRVQLFKLLAPALVLLVGLDLAINLFFAPSDEELAAMQIAMQKAQESGQPVDFTQILRLSGSVILLSLVSAFIGVLYATSIHRFTLAPKEQAGKSVLRLWGAPEFKYLLRSLLIFIISILAASLVMGLTMAILGSHNAWIGAIIAVMLAIYLISRFSIILPETALGKPTSLGRAWGISKGNGSRMVLVVVIIPMALSAPFVLLNLLEIPLLSVVSSIGVYFSTLVSLTTLSLSYQFLLEFYEPSNPQINQQSNQERVEQDSKNNDEDGSFDA